jgi:hypothetical protein
MVHTNVTMRKMAPSHNDAYRPESSEFRAGTRTCKLRDVDFDLYPTRRRRLGFVSDVCCHACLTLVSREPSPLGSARSCPRSVCVPFGFRAMHVVLPVTQSDVSDVSVAVLEHHGAPSLRASLRRHATSTAIPNCSLRPRRLGDLSSAWLKSATAPG